MLHRSPLASNVAKAWPEGGFLTRALSVEVLGKEARQERAVIASLILHGSSPF